ncbi:c-type cytochrome [Candidatus Poriferisocius sp.]|uniref:c-type cytochrome n=1 Tax=Candidatus Poriferisocius sp. TaxID=3101276 RepID=UPI003B52374C
MAVREAGIALRSAVLAICLVGAAGCGSGSSPEVGVGPDGTPDPVLVAGRAVFIDRCSSCHDADGSGTSDGPRLNRGRLLEGYPDPGDAVAVISEGRDRMPAFGGLLTAVEVDAVLRYINDVL